MIKVFNESIRSVKDFERYKICSKIVKKRPGRLERYQIEEQKEKIMRFPIVELTQTQFDEIPKAGDFSTDYLRNEAPFDFKFICRLWEYLPEVIVMGHLVKGVEAICEQHGAGMSVPDKFINRYRVEIVETVGS